MTLAEIMRLALRQLDEDPADIAEYADLFRMWANQGYQIVLQNYYRPRETMTLHTDEKGRAGIAGMDIQQIVELRNAYGADVMHEVSGDGQCIETNARNAELEAVCEILPPPLEADADEPKFPERHHTMLVDYICYKHLMRGNMAKQSRAQAFQSEFYRAAQQLRPQGSGSVTRMKNLYTVSDTRYTRW